MIDSTIKITQLFFKSEDFMENVSDTYVVGGLTDQEDTVLKTVRPLIFQGAWTAAHLVEDLDKKFPGFGKSHSLKIQNAHASALVKLAHININNTPIFPIINPLATGHVRVDPTTVWTPSLKKLSGAEKNLHNQARSKWIDLFTKDIYAAFNFSVAVQSKKLSNILPDAYQLLLQHHQHVGFAALILGILNDIDPVIGDAGCEMRCPFLLDMHAAVQNYLVSKKKLDKAKELAQKFHATFKLTPGTPDKEKLNLEKDVRVVDDLEKYKTDPAFLTLVKELSTAIDKIFKDATKYLGLCVTLTRSCKWSIDDFGTPYYFREGHTLYCVLGKDKSVLDYKPTLKKELAELSCAYMMHMAESLATKAATVHTEPDVQTVEDMLVTVFKECKAKTRKDNLKEGERHEPLPLLPIYAAFRAIILNELAVARPINLVVRRIKMAGNIYTLSDARALHYVPQDSTYKYQPNPSKEEKSRPCFTIDSFSVIGTPPNTSDEEAAALFSEESDQYFTCLQTADLPTMIQIYASGHPPFAGSAEIPEGVDPEQYQQELHSRSRKYPEKVPSLGKLARTHWEASSFTLKNACDEDTNLYAEYAMCRLMALKYGLSTAQQVVKDDTKVKRIARAVCFAPEHVKVMTLKEAEDECTDRKKKTSGKEYPQEFIFR